MLGEAACRATRDDADGAVMDQEPGRSVRVAVSLMRMALALLDRSGEAVVAARLQSAIDAVSVGSFEENAREGWVSPAAPTGASPSGGA